jgi:hypothetical protein
VLFIPLVHRLIAIPALTLTMSSPYYGHGGNVAGDNHRYDRTRSVYVLYFPSLTQLTNATHLPTSSDPPNYDTQHQNPTPRTVFIHRAWHCLLTSTTTDMYTIHKARIPLSLPVNTGRWRGQRPTCHRVLQGHRHLCSFLHTQAGWLTRV